MRPTYQEQHDKVVQAYFDGTLNPYSCKACFIGNILNGEHDWYVARNATAHNITPVSSNFICDSPFDHHTRTTVGEVLKRIECPYNPEEIAAIEYNFLKVIRTNTESTYLTHDNQENHPNYEEALFLAMDSTLDLLKQIHESWNEEVDRPLFKKRELVTA